MIEVAADIRFRCGSLGFVRVPKGFYVYTGSAMRGLGGRVARHRRDEKKLRWHVDYLLAHPKSKLRDVLLFPSETREECFRNLALIKQGGSVVVPRFGSSDCRECRSHLLRIADFPRKEIKDPSSKSKVPNEFEIPLFVM